MKKYKLILFYSLIALLLLNFIPFNSKSTPNSGVPIDEITSILWTWNSSSQNNILKLQDYDIPSNYFFSCVVGQDPDLTNNLTILLSSGAIYWNNFSISSIFTAIDIDDITGDLLPEIVVGTENDGLIVFNVTPETYQANEGDSIYNVGKIGIEYITAIEHPSLGGSIKAAFNRMIYIGGAIIDFLKMLFTGRAPARR